MTILIPSLIVGLTMLAVAFIHFYWAFGGKTWSEAVIPTKSDTQKAFVPGSLATFLVAILFLVIAFYFILLFVILDYFGNYWMVWVMAGGFILRGIGDFKYVGLFKQIRETAFAKNDNRIYTPLVFVLGFLTLYIAFQTLN